MTVKNIENENNLYTDADLLAGSALLQELNDDLLWVVARIYRQRLRDHQQAVSVRLHARIPRDNIYDFRSWSDRSDPNSAEKETYDKNHI